jgi:hypothetical protein
MEQVKPPRSLFVNFPLGHQCGKPRDVELQTRILKDALEILAAASAPGDIMDFSSEWDEPFDFATFMQDTQDMLQQEESSIQDWKPKE